jgi:hypothetical protein
MTRIFGGWRHPPAHRSVFCPSFAPPPAVGNLPSAAAAQSLGVRLSKLSGVPLGGVSPVTDAGTGGACGTHQPPCPPCTLGALTATPPHPAAFKGFAYVDLANECAAPAPSKDPVSAAIASCNGLTFQGCKLRVERAEPDFLTALQAEWAAADAVAAAPPALPARRGGGAAEEILSKGKIRTRPVVSFTQTAPASMPALSLAPDGSLSLTVRRHKGIKATAVRGDPIISSVRAEAEEAARLAALPPAKRAKQRTNLRPRGLRIAGAELAQTSVRASAGKLDWAPLAGGQEGEGGEGEEEDSMEEKGMAELRAARRALAAQRGPAAAVEEEEEEEEEETDADMQEVEEGGDGEDAPGSGPEPVEAYKEEEMAGAGAPVEVEVEAPPVPDDLTASMSAERAAQLAFLASLYGEVEEEGTLGSGAVEMNPRPTKRIKGQGAQPPPPPAPPAAVGSGGGWRDAVYGAAAAAAGRTQTTLRDALKAKGGKAAKRADSYAGFALIAEKGGVPAYSQPIRVGVAGSTFLAPLPGLAWRVHADAGFRMSGLFEGAVDGEEGAPQAALPAPPQPGQQRAPPSRGGQGGPGRPSVAPRPPAPPAWKRPAPAPLSTGALLAAAASFGSFGREAPPSAAKPRR